MSKTQASDTASRKGLQDAINWSKGRGRGGENPSTTQAVTDKAKYDENYEAIFGKRELPHGT